MYFKAVIFDLDDTLIDAHYAWKRGFQKTLASIRHHMTESEFSRLYRMNSQEIRNFIRDIYESENLGGLMPFETVMDNLKSEMGRQYARDIQAKPYALEFVTALHRLGMPACIATLTSRDLAEKTLTRLGFSPYLQFVITGDEVGASKTTADIYLAAAKRLGFPPSDIVVFEDCQTAVRTAYMADFLVCRVADQYQDRPVDELNSYCHWRITDYLDARRLISQAA